VALTNVLHGHPSHEDGGVPDLQLPNIVLPELIADGASVAGVPAVRQGHPAPTSEGLYGALRLAKATIPKIVRAIEKRPSRAAE